MNDANQKKLIRLITEDNNCVFDSQFDEEVLIAPQTEVALKSLVISFASPTVAVTGGNENNVLKIFHDNLEHSIEVEPGVYSPNTMHELLATISRQLNGTMRLGEEVKEHGLQYSIALNERQRVEIQAIRHHPTSITGDDYYNSGSGGFPGQQGRYWDVNGAEVDAESAAFTNDGLVYRAGAKGGSSAANYEATAYSDFSFIGGMGVWRSTIFNLTVPAGAGDLHGFVIGFTTDRSKLRNGTLADGDVVLGMRIQATQAAGMGRYQFKSSAAAAYTDTITSPGTLTADNGGDVNDVLEWRSEKNQTDGKHKLRLFVHQNGVGAVLLGEVERTGIYAPDQKLYGFYAFYGAKTANDITECLYTPSFFNSFIDKSELKTLGDTSLQRGSAVVHSNLASLTAFNYGAKIRYRMNTNNVPLKESIMGFNAADVNLQDNTAFYDFTDFDILFDTADVPTAFDFRSVIADLGLGELRGIAAPTQSFRFFGSQNYIVELLNLPLNSYDSFQRKRGRANILAVIPQNEFNQGNLNSVLMYEPSEMTYISLTNKSEISLRNIRARVVFPDYSAVDTAGLSTIMLHMRPSK